MTRSFELLTTLRVDGDLAASFAVFPLEFDITHRPDDAALRLPSGMPLELIAGQGAGGAFFLCGDPAAERPVLYVDSEGQAGLIAGSLVEALTLELVLPRWGDSLSFSAGGDLSTMLRFAPALDRELHTEHPAYAARQDRLAAALGLGPLPPLEDVVRKLHSAVRATEPDYVLIYDDEYGEERAESLFGRRQPPGTS
ncbi:hypothetical protein [Saccharopolyspora shandongensis]|uniref:hypothetical protein n=1 Tax=Saccharopolyspora shandongensis TaxID=418495 RepID=UPI0033E0BA36